MHVLAVLLPGLVAGHIYLGHTPRELHADKLGIILNGEVRADLDGLWVAVAAPLESNVNVSEERTESKRRDAIEPARKLLDLVIARLLRDGQLDDGAMAVRERHAIHGFKLPDRDVRSLIRIIERREKLLARHIHLSDTPIPRSHHTDVLIGVEEQHLGDAEATRVLVPFLGSPGNLKELTTQQFGGHPDAVVLDR